MSTIEVRLEGTGRCEVRHRESGAMLHTEAPPEYGGGGRSFSATDLVAAGLGACVATTLQAVAGREDLAAESFTVEVSKQLARQPRRISRLEVHISCAQPLTDQQRRKLLAAARTCPVHRSLDSDVEVVIKLTSSS